MTGGRDALNIKARMRDWIRWLRAGWALGLGFAALSIFIAASVIFYVQQQSGDAVVRRALEIEISLADVFSALQDAELGERGFLITGDPKFLEPYRAGSERLAGHLQEFADRVAPIRELAAQHETLRVLIAEKRAEMTKSIALYQAGLIEDAFAQVRSGNGKRIMDQVRREITAIDAREDRVVETRQAQVRRTGTLVAVSITAAVVLLGVVTLVAMREVVRRSELSRFLPVEVAHRLASGDLSLRNGRELPAAIAFVDIRGSTALAERLDVAELSTVLTRFRGDVLAAATANGGLVDKFIGDGALVVFGVHDASAEAAAQAIGFARDLRRRHDISRTRSTVADYDIGMGIHYGVAFCGIVGTAGRLEFTVLGDCVNVAARLEKETKVHGVDLLVSDAVLHHAGEGFEGWRELACDGLRGRRTPIGLFTERSTQGSDLG